MIHVSRSALAVTCLLAAGLLAPTLGIALQSEAALQAFHNRNLSAWPALESFPSEPVAYFQSIRGWLSDRVYPIEQADQLQANLLFWLGSPPEPRVSLGADGHVFLNAGSNHSVGEILTVACISAHEQKIADMLEQTFAKRAKSGEHGGSARPVDVIAFPSPPSLYADKLPDSVSPQHRQACLERQSGRSPLLSIHGTAPVMFMYPLPEMLAARDAEGFYPKGNFHPMGLSIKLVRDRYLARRQVSGVVSETLVLGQAPSEVLLMSGVHRDEPAYFIVNPNVRERPRKNAELARWINALFVRNELPARVYTNSKPLLEERVLMISDSYGAAAAPVFAGAFRQLVQVTTNYLRPGEIPRLIRRIDYVEPFDRLIVLFNEGNAHQVPAWLAI
jgi:hypothetical protein